MLSSQLSPLFSRPQTLVPGALYYRFQSDQLNPEKVRFSSYKASPALVMIFNANEELCLCLRDEIFEMKEFKNG